MVLGNSVKDVGEGLFSSLPRVCWAVAPVQLWSFGLLCVRSLPLRPSLCSHTKGKKLLLAPFFFISFCRFPSSPLLHHSAAHLLEQELSWLFLTCLWFSWETFSTFILQKRRKCFFYRFAEANHETTVKKHFDAETFFPADKLQYFMFSTRKQCTKGWFRELTFLSWCLSYGKTQFQKKNCSDQEESEELDQSLLPSIEHAMGKD